MASRLRVAAETVAGLLSNSLTYTLPAFQRSYVWTIDEVDRLIDDIQVAMKGRDADRWQYLGTIILACANDATEAAIVDGQQRLTTFTILFAILRDIATDAATQQRLHALIAHPRAAADEIDRYRLRPRHLTATFFRRYVQGEGATRIEQQEPDAELSSSQLNILRNRDHLRRRLTAMTARQRGQLSEFVHKGCELAVLSVESEAMARRIFINAQTTGLQPSINDILRADVLERIADGAREACGQIWDACEAEHDPAGLRRLLRHLRDRRLEEYASEGSVASDIIDALRSPADAESFVRVELADASLIYAAFARHDLYSERDADEDMRSMAGPINRRLQYLSWLEMHDDWQPAVLHWLLDRQRQPATGNFLCWVRIHFKNHRNTSRAFYEFDVDIPCSVTLVVITYNMRRLKIKPPVQPYGTAFSWRRYDERSYKSINTPYLALRRGPAKSALQSGHDRRVG